MSTDWLADTHRFNNAAQQTENWFHTYLQAFYSSLLTDCLRLFVHLVFCFSYPTRKSETALWGTIYYRH